jgi:hypothetical protein
MREISKRIDASNIGQFLLWVNGGFQPSFVSKTNRIPISTHAPGFLLPTLRTLL